MKRKLLYVMMMGIVATANANSSIPYQNPNMAGTNSVNTTPNTPPAGFSNAYQQEYQQQPAMSTQPTYPMANPNQAYPNAQMPMNQNGGVANNTMPTQTESINEQGQRVIRTEEYQRMQNPNVQQAPASAMAAKTTTEKFWNMSNNQIRNVRRQYESKSAAIGQDISPAKCVQSTVNITNSPGANLPVIRLDGRNIATVLITDVLGNPWSIDYISNSSDITIIRDQDNPEVSTFHIQTNDNNGQGNFAVKLKDNPVPIVFSFVNSQREVDCLMVAKLDVPSPNADIKTQSLSASAMDSSLNSVLYGVAPKGSRALKLSTDAATAWQMEDGKVVLRTKYELLAPAFESVTRSPDGTRVYKVQYSPVYTYRYNDVIGDFRVNN